MIMRENYVQKIMAFADTPFVKVITGVRRSGKSTIMQMIMERLAEQGIAAEQIVSFRFDSMEYENMTAKEMFEEIKGKLSSDEKTYIFFACINNHHILSCFYSSACGVKVPTALSRSQTPESSAIICAPFSLSGERTRARVPMRSMK